MEYRYPHFKRRLMIEDTAFGSYRGGPSPGEPVPDFDLPTTDGGRVRKSDFVGRRPLLLTFGSIT
jgi:peroxiredoxin